MTEPDDPPTSPGRRRLLLGTAALFIIAVATLWAAAYLVPLPDRLDLADSTVITYADGRPAHVFLSEDDKWRLPTELDHVDPAYLDALIALEDKRFYSHPGVDPIAIGRAAIDNLSSGTTVSGASTITMQLVRLLEPRPRTLRAKAVEAFRAFQLERHLSKEEILQAYLRFIPFGGNLEGVEAATLSYWDRTPAALSTAEIATLLAVPQSPNARRPTPHNQPTLRQARDQIAHRLAALDAIPLSNRPDALAQNLAAAEVPTATGRPPREIPHLAHWLIAHRPDHIDQAETGRDAPSIRIETTLERAVQRRIARIVADHGPRLRATGAPHAALVVMESTTGQVHGVVGNLGFDLATPGSHLPAFATPRATGSLIKPVVYAAALDQGLLAPSHALQDVPMIRGDYRPQNFDRTYRGLVEAEEALALSLNLPFVRLLEQLGVDEFVQTIARFGLLESVRAAGDGGLELVVGGLPASPLDVAALYAGFAPRGQPKTPTFYARPAPETASLNEGSPHQAITPAAAWLTIRALTRRPNPWSPVGPRRARDAGDIWKTGTSYAYHDAWTAGFGDRYTAVVWAGDLAHRRHPELVGATVAAPLFFDIIEAIDDPFPVAELRQTEALQTGLAEIEICPRSGRRIGPHCPHSATTLAPATTAAPERCDLHIEIAVDAATGTRLPAGCRPATVDHTQTRLVERLPAAVARHHRARGHRAGTIPDIHPGCQVEAQATLAITAPAEHTTLFIDAHRPADHQLVRLEAYSSMGSPIHWYIDGRHIASAPASDAVYWTPTPGHWTITATDERGIRTSRHLVVE